MPCSPNPHQTCKTRVYSPNIHITNKNIYKYLEYPGYLFISASRSPKRHFFKLRLDSELCFDSELRFVSELRLDSELCFDSELRLVSRLRLDSELLRLRFDSELRLDSKLRLDLEEAGSSDSAYRFLSAEIFLDLELCSPSELGIASNVGGAL